MFDIELLRRLNSGAAMSETDVAEGRDGRDYQEPAFLEAAKPRHTVPNLTDAEVAQLISQQARDAVIGFEVSSRREYERKYIRPEAPAGQSGITVGIGYDLGYNSQADVRSHWAGLLADEQIEKLVNACGLTGSKARACLGDYQDITVPWDAAIEVYQRSTMPRFGRKVLNTFPNAVETKGHAFGALFSLVYNRGDSLSGESRREMVYIRDLMEQRAFDKVPTQIRAMKRVWEGRPGFRGVLLRRDAEAILFDRGLELMRAPPSTAGVEMAQAPAAAAGSLEAAAVGGDAYLGDARFYEEQPEDPNAPIGLESAEGWEKVSWPNDDESPDYSHITDRSRSNQTFTLNARVLELLIRLNDFEPRRDQNRIVFALRGAHLVASATDTAPQLKQLDRDALTLRDVRPDHKTQCCVIGVYDLTTGRLSGFSSSTVPHRRAVYEYKVTRKAGNMMPAGCYSFIVGWHKVGQPTTVPGCLTEQGFRKAVLRSVNDLRYDTADVWENHQSHGDNLHPASSDRSAKFSSYGCLVVNGTYKCESGDRERGVHTGEWGEFRARLGLKAPGSGDHGKKFDVVVLTGLEAAIAANLCAASPEDDPPEARDLLGRLRQGSRGERVSLLQKALGQPQTGRFDHILAKAVADRQKQETGKADGIYSPAMDQRTKFGVFAPLPIVVAVAASGTAAQGKLETAGGSSQSPEVRQAFDDWHYQLGLYETASRRQGRQIDDGNLEALGEVNLEFGMTTLKAIGATVARDLEFKLKDYVCQQVSAQSDDVRKRLDDAAAKGTKMVREVLITTLTKISVFIPRALVEPVVDVVINNVVMPALGNTGQAAMGQLGQGSDWLCQRWTGNIVSRYSAEGSASAPSLPALARMVEPAPSVSPHIAGVTTPANPAGTVGLTLENMTKATEDRILDTQAKNSEKVDGDIVDCSVFAPRSVRPFSSFLVQVFLHEPQHHSRVQTLATGIDSAASGRGVKSLQVPIKRNTIVEVTLEAAGMVIEEPTQKVVWRGDPTFCQFLVTVPDGCAGKNFYVNARVSVGGGLVGRVGFLIDARFETNSRPQSIVRGDDVRRYRYAFMSYASHDRNEVLKRSQALQAVGVQFFQDVLSLDPGARWETQVFTKIDQCDLFLLFWSKAAKESEYVKKEALYALARQQVGEGPDIVPVIIEGPPIIVPFEELKHLHFNDKIRYLMDCPAGQSIGGSGQTKTSPANSRVGELFALIQQAAGGERPNGAAAQRYIKELNDEVSRSGQSLTSEQMTALMAIMSDTRILQSNQTGPDMLAQVDAVQALLGTSPVDKVALGTALDQLHRDLGDARLPVPPATIKALLKMLRNARQFDQLSKIADRLITRDPALLGTLSVPYAQGLIDSGRLIAGIEVLTAAEQSGKLTKDEAAEVDGLLGRAHKQIYLNFVRTQSDAMTLRDSMGHHLVTSVEHYAKHYDPAQPGTTYYHGINVVALLKRAKKDGIAVTGKSGQAEDIARAIISAIEPEAEIGNDVWKIVTLGEAYLAAGDLENAAKWYGRFANHPKVSAFELNSAIRQLEEVWQLSADQTGAGAIVTCLKTVLAHKDGGSVTLKPKEQRALANAQTVQFEKHFETKTDGGDYINFGLLKQIVHCGDAVAAVQKPVGQSWVNHGTAFLVKGSDFSPDLADDKSYLLTNAHVMWDFDQPGHANSMETSGSPVDWRNARIVFESHQADGRNEPYECARILWQSPSTCHDAVLFELRSSVPRERASPLAMAGRECPLRISDTAGVPATRLCVLGHPGGRELALSFVGSIQQNNAVLVDKGPREATGDPEFLHYSTPTEGGNSGSPVFAADTWRVVALHHAGYPDHGRPKLGGKAGNNRANEGIWIESIRAAVKEARSSKTAKGNERPRWWNKGRPPSA